MDTNEPTSVQDSLGLHSAEVVKKRNSTETTREDKAAKPATTGQTPNGTSKKDKTEKKTEEEVPDKHAAGTKLGHYILGKYH